MAHPVAKGLQCVRCQLLPNARNVTIKKGLSHFIQLTAHTHLTSQGLWDIIECQQISAEVKNKDETAVLFCQYLVCFPLPTPHLTLCNSAKDSCMRTTRLLKRSSSCSRTTEVGEMSVPNFLRITSMSNISGSLFWMSCATWLMCSSRLTLPPESPEARSQEEESTWQH